LIYQFDFTEGFLRPVAEFSGFFILIWIDKTYMDLSIYYVQNMSPEKAAEYIAQMYWNIKSEKKD